MPSSKPNADEIRDIRIKRGLYDKPDNSAANVRKAVLPIMQDGYLDASRLAKIAEVLRANHNTGGNFPGNAIAYACDSIVTGATEFDSNVDAEMLHVITAALLADQEDWFEQDSPTDSEVLREMIHRTDWYGREPLTFVFDDEVPVTNHALIAFTGPTEKSRRAWFDVLKGMGCAGCVPDWYCDVLVVADKAAASKSFTSTIYAAIRCRAAYGRPLVVRESKFLEWMNKRVVDT